MADTLAPVMPARPGVASQHGDTRAMNDILALLTDGEAAACSAEITAQAAGLVITVDGRPPDRSPARCARPGQPGHARHHPVAGRDEGFPSAQRREEGSS